MEQVSSYLSTHLVVKGIETRSQSLTYLIIANINKKFAVQTVDKMAPTFCYFQNKNINIFYLQRLNASNSKKKNPYIMLCVA